MLPAIERSAAKAFLALPDLAWIADDDIQSVDRHIELIAEGNAWVAVDEHDHPVGFLNAAWMGDSLHIWEFAVRHDLQGRGLGRGLLEYVVQEARSQGAEAITLTTFRHVPWNQPFYERVGFRTLPTDAIAGDLRTVLDKEVEHGIPGEKRCAMILPLR